MTKVRDVIDELKKSSSLTNHSTFKDLEFVMKWNNLPKEEKNKKYSQYSCHELNLFIFFKD